MSDSWRPHGLQHARLPCPSPTPRACSNSRPLSRWCHPTMLSSVVPFSCCLQSLPASGSFPMSQLFVSGGQSIGVSASASVLPMNIQDWVPLRWTGWILQSKGLSWVFSNTTGNSYYIPSFALGWRIMMTWSPFSAVYSLVGMSTTTKPREKENISQQNTVFLLLDYSICLHIYIFLRILRKNIKHQL